MVDLKAVKTVGSRGAAKAVPWAALKAGQSAESRAQQLAGKLAVLWAV